MFQALTKPTSPQAVVLLTLTMFLWAGNHVLGRWAGDHIPPMTLAFFRWGIAGALMLPLAAADLRRDWPVIRANLPLMLVLSVLGSGVYNTLQYIALTSTTVSNAAIINSWAPVLIALLGAAVFRDRIRPVQFAGIALSLAGVAVVILHGEFERLATLSFNRGDLVMIIATAIWALYTTLLRYRPAISTLSFAAFTFAVAGLVNLPLAGYEYAAGLEIRWSWAVLAAIFYAAVLASVAAYYFYAAAVDVLGATRTGSFIHLIPMFATLLALVIVNEVPQIYHALGFGLIVVGVVLAQKAGGGQR
ncbi:MAG: DMT family transporter [Hyphomicrobium sp.]|nr:DMT family transporter [Hyphomicrobium sp.]